MNQLHIVVTWKNQGEEFCRPDLLARWFRENLPRVLFRGDIDKTFNADAERRIIAKHGGLIGVLQCPAAIESLIAAGTEPNRDGFDDYILNLRHEVTLSQTEPTTSNATPAGPALSK